ncbi:hypothetical protein HDK77DRAFT_25483 [Phyllosticta capitalensis]
MSTTTFEAMAKEAKVPTAPLNRKRSRASMMLLHDESGHDHDQEDKHHGEESTSTGAGDANDSMGPPPLPPSRPSVDRKRSRTSGVMDGLGLIPAAETWQLNMDDMLRGVVESSADSKTAGCNGRSCSSDFRFPSSYVPGQSMVVLCVVESSDVHLRLLCASLAHLLTLSPTLHPILLTRHSPSAIFSNLQSTSRSPPSLPTIMAKNHPTNHFLRLGLLHPLGGGLAGMDALVLVDPQGRRRLVVPFGWGVGKGAVGGAQQGAGAVGERLMDAVVEGVGALEEERARETGGAQ